MTSTFYSGGDAKTVSPVTDPEEVQEAIEFANEALAAIEHLQQLNREEDRSSPADEKPITVAIENYIDYFGIPQVALEEHDDSNIVHVGDVEDEPENSPAQASKLKRVLLHLLAIVQRIFKAVFDLFAEQKLAARNMIPHTKEYIGRSDSLSASVAQQLNIRDRTLMLALHIDGLPPRKAPELYDTIAATFEKNYSHSALNETIAVISAAKEKDHDRLLVTSEKLHAKLKAGFVDSLKEADADDLSLFNAKKDDNSLYYISDAMFGQNYITGVIGKELKDDATFNYSCGIRRDPEVPLRTVSFPVLKPDEIRHISRTTLRICENIIRFSSDEDLLQQALRRAAYLVTKEPDKASVVALKEVAAAGQSIYIVYLRYTTKTMQSLMRWCNNSLRLYEEVKKENGKS